MPRTALANLTVITVTHIEDARENDAYVAATLVFPGKAADVGFFADDVDSDGWVENLPADVITRILEALNGTETENPLTLEDLQEDFAIRITYVPEAVVELSPRTRVLGGKGK